jgi:hypothetical protein
MMIQNAGSREAAWDAGRGCKESREQQQQQGGGAGKVKTSSSLRGCQVIYSMVARRQGRVFLAAHPPIYVITNAYTRAASVDVHPLLERVRVCGINTPSSFSGGATIPFNGLEHNSKQRRDLFKYLNGACFLGTEDWKTVNIG